MKMNLLNFKGKKLLKECFEASDVGVMWLKPCSCIELGDKEDSLYKSYYLKANITINTGISSDIEAELPEETNTEYKVTTKEEKKTLKVERLAKKNEGLIQDLVEEVGDRSEKKTSITQDIDSISQKVSDIEDLTNDVEGVKTITLGNCVEGKLLSLHIYGNGTVFNYLYPSDTLYPNDSLYPCGDSRIVVSDKDGNQTIYELGVLEVLRSNDEAYDEFILENGQAKVIRRVNKSGSTKAKEKIEDLGKVEILLKEGTNTITIQNYTARIKAKWAVKSDYTNVLATRVEMNASLKLEAQKFDVKLEKKVNEDDYTSAEIMLKLNNDESKAQIKADKISLERKEY